MLLENSEGFTTFFYPDKVKVESPLKMRGPSETTTWGPVRPSSDKVSWGAEKGISFCNCSSSLQTLVRVVSGLWQEICARVWPKLLFWGWEPTHLHEGSTGAPTLKFPHFFMLGTFWDTEWLHKALHFSQPPLSGAQWKNKRQRAQIETGNVTLT